jgi:hypothetical protein
MTAPTPIAECPSCSSAESTPFYEVRGVPVHQVRLVRSRDAALNCPRGDLQLRLCTPCGFVWNAAFDAARMAYQEDYESTQAVSPTFNAFHERLARDLIERFDLHGRQIVEIGCGQGEFVTMLAEIGGNRGWGFDRVIRGEIATDRVELVKDFYGPSYGHLRPDFVCCKMTLEHVHDVGAFLADIRATIGDRPDVVVFCMIPEITRILELRAFWDVYYEHCSYFSPGSLARAFRKAGFTPLQVWTDYDDQYVLIAARPGSGAEPPLANEEAPRTLAAKVRAFSEEMPGIQTRWRAALRNLHEAGQRTVLWGGGSKAVAFLTTLGVTDEVAYAVDVNPRRDGTYIAGTGQPIATPERLVGQPPDVLIVMSPIYLPEITADLERLGVRPRRVLTVEAPDPLLAA